MKLMDKNKELKNMLEIMDEKLTDHTTQKIYAIGSKRYRANGEQYVYKNYQVSIPYQYLEIMNIKDKMFLYRYKNEVYFTNSLPDGSVPAKKLNIHTRNKSKTDETKNRRNKRFFIIPKKLFPQVDETMKVLFTLDSSQKEIFSQNPITLKMKLIKNN